MGRSQAAAGQVEDIIMLHTSRPMVSPEWRKLDWQAGLLEYPGARNSVLRISCTPPAARAESAQGLAVVGKGRAWFKTGMRIQEGHKTRFLHELRAELWVKRHSQESKSRRKTYGSVDNRRIRLSVRGPPTEFVRELCQWPLICLLQRYGSRPTAFGCFTLIA